jgi:integrase
MGIKIRTNRHGFLGFQIRWQGERKWAGTKDRDDGPRGRRRTFLEAKARLIEEDLRAGIGLEAAFQRHALTCPRQLLPEETAPPASAKTVRTIRDYYDTWIKRQVAPRVRLNTQLTRQCYFDGLILPRFGDRPLSDTGLTTSDLMDFQAELLRCGLRDKPLKISSVKSIILGHFRSMWTEARTVDKLITANPFADMKWPETRAGKPDPFTEADRDKVLAYLEKKMSRYYPWVFALFWTGMRPSESTALRVSDVDLEAGTLSLTKSRVRGSDGGTKTAASERTITVMPHVLTVLRKVPRPLHEKAGDFFFLDSKGHGIRHDFWAMNNWSRICKAAKVRPRKFYATRHTFISAALSHGESPLEVAEYCGTSMRMIDRHYGAWIGKRGFTKLIASFGNAQESNPTSNLAQKTG